MRVLNALSLAVILGLLCTSPALAQLASNSDDGLFLSVGAMDAALADHESAVDQRRTQLAEILADPQVREIASERGIDMERVESLGAGLSDSQMKAIAPLVTEATAALDNGLGGISVIGLIIILALLLGILIVL